MMNFGEALELLKAGNRVQRVGWNGRGMYLYLVSDHYDNRIEETLEPYIMMYTAQGLHQPGWLASQADMLAEDWQVV